MNNNDSPFGDELEGGRFLDGKITEYNDKSSLFEETPTLEELIEELESISGYESPLTMDITPLTSFEVSKGKAADVAYLTWENSGNITPADVSRMSRSDEYSAVEPVSSKEATEALQALSMFGLVASDFTDTDNDTENNRLPDYSMDRLSMDGLKEPDTNYMEDWSLDDISIEYSTGSSEQLENPDYKSRLNVSSPEEAFQLIGEMQEKYEFDKGIYRRLSGHL